MSTKIKILLIIISLFILLVNADNSNNDSIKETDTVKTRLPMVDSISGATKIEKELELAKEIEKKEIIDSNKNFIEIFDDSTSDFKYYDSTKRITNMIIFEDNQESEIPSLNEGFQEDLESKQQTWYKSDNFIPENINDFFKATPKYNYKINIIQPGKNKISHSLGEQIFFIAYRYFRSNNIKNAKTLFEKLLNYNQRIIDSYYYLSWCSYINKDYVTSIDYMNEAILQAEKENLSNTAISDYYYQIGNFYFKLDDYGNSIIYYFKSLRKNSENYKCYNKLGISYYLIGNPLKALEMWKQGMNGGDQDSSNNYKWLEKKLNY